MTRGLKARQSHTGENESPWKIPFLLFTVPAFLLFTLRFVLHVLIMICRTFLIFGQIFYISTPSLTSYETPSQTLFDSLHNICACLRTRASIVSCCLHPNDFWMHPFCFSSKIWFKLQCSKILLLIIDVNNLCTTKSQVMDQQLSSCMVSPFLCHIHVFPSIKNLQIWVGSLSMFVKQRVRQARIEVKLFSLKLLSLLGQDAFQLLVFHTATVTSLTGIH
jgi:hypothetical protein